VEEYEPQESLECKLTDNIFKNAKNKSKFIIIVNNKKAIKT
jgi:hypothetical protein